jgi:photosystem II stability/assembly factor-like uncharacterized protein
MVAWVGARNSWRLLAGCLLAIVVIVGGASRSTASVNVSRSGWAWSNPIPQGRTLRAIAFSGGTGYAVGFGGTALSTANAGASWSGLATGTSADLERLQVVNPSTLVVGGASGCVTRISEDAGQLFRRIFNVAEASCAEPVAAFSFISAKVGFLLLRNGAIETTTDGGQTFSRRTGIPGTPAASGGGALTGTDVHFLSPVLGIAFVSAADGSSAAYMTPDGGVSWNPVTLPVKARVTSVHFVDEKNAYAIGPETLLRSTDGGEKWEAEPIAAGRSFNSIDCAGASECLLTVPAGNEIVKTSDGGATASVTTPSSSLIFSAAYASPTQIVAVGESGATVLSADAGGTYTAASLDVGGEYNKLRLGPEGMLLAPGSAGDLALSSDAGQSWRVLATQSSDALLDVSFASGTLGYALDAGGGLQRTDNAGASWQTLNPGTATPARAVVALGTRTVLLLGPRGINRAVAGGPFAPVGGIAASARVSDYDLVGSTVFAFGPGGHSLLRSSNEGASWVALALPLARKASSRHGHRVGATPGVAIRSVAFTSASGGMLLDSEGRLWKTSSAGRRWSEVDAAGGSEGVQLAFASPAEGFMSIRGFGQDVSDGYVLRTTDGGATWHPQEISLGTLPYDGLVASSGRSAAALLDSTSISAEALDRVLFTTTSGGDIAGPAETLALSTTRASLTKRSLHAAKGSVRVSGTLSGALGGETIVVSRRDLAGGPWHTQQVVAGANGGSFATSWQIARSSLFVAQWAGDSGRPGLGSKVLRITVG